MLAEGERQFSLGLASGLSLDSVNQPRDRRSLRQSQVERVVPGSSGSMEQRGLAVQPGQTI